MLLPPRLSLAFLPTPIQKITYQDFPFLIKRDDLTGMETTGNKIRKLEYILADALAQKAEMIFTTGGEQSNHARATAAACRSLGLDVKLFLWGEPKEVVTGNIFINRFLGADIRYLSYEEFLTSDEIMKAEAEKLTAEGRKVYIVPEGGSSSEGITGYIRFWDELEQQMNLSEIDEVYVAAGSGGTVSGLLLGAALKDIPVKINAVSVLYSPEVLEGKVRHILENFITKYAPELKLPDHQLEIIGGYSAEGYKHISGEKVAVLKDFAMKTGIIFDPVYTGKAFFAFQDRCLSAGEKKNILFLHTGGLFGVFEKNLEYLQAGGLGKQPVI